MSYRQEENLATQRYISTSFWNDPWILDECTSDERYIYLYLLTSPNSNIAGIYELSLRTAELHTGYDREQLKRILGRFAEDGKAYYYGGYVIIPKWPTHQRWDTRSKIKSGIENVLESLPRAVLAEAKRVGYEFPIPYDMVSIPYAYESNYSDSDLDTDTDTDIKEAPTAEAEASTDLEPVTTEVQEVQADESWLYLWIKERFEKEQPHGRFTNYGKEGKAIKGIISKAQARDPTNPGGFAEGMIETFAKLRKKDRKFYGKQPFLPSSLNASGIWDRVLTEAYERYQRAQAVAADWEEPPF